MEKPPKIPGLVIDEENPLNFEPDPKFYRKMFEDRTLNKIVNGANPENWNEIPPTFEEAKTQIQKDLNDLVDYLATTEPDQDKAREYYVKLYEKVFEKIEKADSLADIAEAFKDMKFEEISSRFSEVIRGGWKEMFLNRRRGRYDVDLLESGPLKRIFFSLDSALKTYMFMRKTFEDK